jgi:hypothetical protein
MEYVGGLAMSAADAESLIAHLSGVHPDDRDAFRQAAEAALTQASVYWGPGLIHRTVASIWRQYFHPPVVSDNGWYLGNHKPSALEHGEYKPRRFRVVG